MSDSTTTLFKQASLLGLPRELRLQIYDHVFQLDLNYTVLEQWRDTHTAEKGFISVPVRVNRHQMDVPWLSLMLTCKAIAVELRARMGEAAFRAKKSNRTWVLDFEATRGGMALGTTTWRRIPCPPNQMEELEAYYNASRGFRAWGDGGPHGITSGLYQTLNHLVHCGPLFDSRSLLPRPMRIRELRITIIERRGGLEEDADEHAHYRLGERDTDPERTLYALGSIIGQINRTGVLRSYVDEIRLRSGDKILQWSPNTVEGGGIPEYWNRYGFEWGMGLYRSTTTG